MLVKVEQHLEVGTAFAGARLLSHLVVAVLV
jgi:hypothetical protein